MATLKDFADLKSLRATLQQQEQARALEQAERAKREQAQRQEANLFQNALGGVKPMPKSDRLEPAVPRAAAGRPAPAPRTQAEDDAAVLREMMSDQFDVEHLLDEEPNLSFARSGVGQDTMKRLRKGYWPVQDELDLHNLRRDEAREQVGEFLRRASARRLRCVGVIHGRGLGSARGEPVLRSMVHSWLEQREEVVAFCAAHSSDGGHGALIVLLKAALQT